MEELSICCLVLYILLLSRDGLQVAAVCNSPPSISHATSETETKTSTLTVASYTCDTSQGYAPRGNSTVPCFNLHGYASWATPDFRCERVQCHLAPRDLQHSEHNFYRPITKSRREEYNCYNRRYRYGSRYRYGYRCDTRTTYYTENQAKVFYYTSTVNYTCSTGYKPSDGSNQVSASCQDDGSWSSPSTTCQGVYCGNITALEGVVCTTSNNRYPSIVTCSCERGYERVVNSNTRQLDNSYTLSCQSNGVWSQPDDGKATECTRIICPRPQTVQYMDQSKSNFSSNPYRYEDYATYVCIPGYEPTINSTVQCQYNRQWTAIPSCVRKDCGTPPSVENGFVAHYIHNTKFDASATYDCSRGYEIHGHATIRCAEDGGWSTPPLCASVRCGAPPDVQNSRRNVAGHYYNQTATYTCQFGFRLAGNRTVFCQYDGYWSTPPDCQAISCGSPPNITNGYMRSHTTQSVHYFCKRGHSLNDEKVSFVTCQPDGNWSQLPVCVPVVTDSAAAHTSDRESAVETLGSFSTSSTTLVQQDGSAVTNTHVPTTVSSSSTPNRSSSSWVQPSATQSAIKKGMNMTSTQTIQSASTTSLGTTTITSQTDASTSSTKPTTTTTTSVAETTTSTATPLKSTIVSTISDLLENITPATYNSPTSTTSSTFNPLTSFSSATQSKQPPSVPSMPKIKSLTYSQVHSSPTSIPGIKQPIIASTALTSTSTKANPRAASEPGTSASTNQAESPSTKSQSFSTLKSSQTALISQRPSVAPSTKSKQVFTKSANSVADSDFLGSMTQPQVQGPVTNASKQQDDHSSRSAVISASVLSILCAIIIAGVLVIYIIKRKRQSHRFFPLRDSTDNTSQSEPMILYSYKSDSLSSRLTEKSSFLLN